MKNVKMIACLAVVICLLVTAAIAQEPELPSTGLSTSVDLGYVSKYVWRGIPLNTDPSFQPSITISHPSGFSLNLWGSVDTTNIIDRSGDLREADYTLNYAFNAKGRDMNAGIAYYSYPNVGEPSTSEAYMSICFGGPLATTFSANYDFDEVDGYYLSLGIGKTCATPWVKAPSVGLSAKVGYGSDKHNEYYYGTDKAALTDVLLSASMPYKMKNGMTLTPNVSYTMIMNSDIKDVMKVADMDRNNFFAGVTLSTSF